MNEFDHYVSILLSIHTLTSGVCTLQSTMPHLAGRYSLFSEVVFPATQMSGACFLQNRGSPIHNLLTGLLMPSTNLWFLAVYWGQESSYCT